METAGGRGFESRPFRSFNEAMTFRSWKPMLAAAVVAPSHGFNEAMTFRSWKPQEQACLPVPAGPTASMRP